MISKVVILALFAICSIQAAPKPGILAPAAVVAPYASSYNAHTVNHAIAAPAFSTYVAASAAYSALPYAAHPAAYSALPGAYAHPAAYSALPGAYAHPAAYSALPYTAGFPTAYSAYSGIPAASYVL